MVKNYLSQIFPSDLPLILGEFGLLKLWINIFVKKLLFFCTKLKYEIGSLIGKTSKNHVFSTFFFTFLDLWKIMRIELIILKNK